MKIPRKYRLECAGLWVIAGSWAGSETDGEIPDYMIDEWGGSPEVVEWLVKSGLWARTNDDGVEFSKWLEYQPSKAEEDERKARDAERKREARARGTRAAAQKKDRPQNVRPDVSRTPAGQNAESVLPGPSRPDLTTPYGVVPRDEHGKTGTRLPSSFRLTAPMLRWGQDHAPNVNHASSTQKFISHYRSVAGRQQFKTDWDEAWKAWIIGDQEKAAARPQQFKTAAQQKMDAANTLFMQYQQEENETPQAIEGMK